MHFESRRNFVKITKSKNFIQSLYVVNLILLNNFNILVFETEYESSIMKNYGAFESTFFYQSNAMWSENSALIG